MDIKNKLETEKKIEKNLDQEEEDEIYNLIKSSALLKGLEYNEREIESIGNWRFPKEYKNLTNNQLNEIRKAYKIEIDGEDIPFPINNFSGMKLPNSILNALKKKNIFHPTPIQMQGIPVV